MNGYDSWVAFFGEPAEEQRDSVPRSRSGKTLYAEARGASPAVAQTDRCGVIFDGVLHNLDEFRARTGERLPHDASVAELIARAYIDQGAEIFLQLKGMFALIIHDRATDQLLCTRDRVGLHPLFYTAVRGRLLLSPSIEALLRHPDVQRALNRAALVDHLSRRWLDNHDTYFASVKRIPPRHVLFVEGDRRRFEEYWDPAPPGRKLAWIPDEEAQEQFDCALHRAVSRCVALGASAVSLSGGIDSSAIALFAADVCAAEQRQKPLALSLVMPGPHVDESSTQRAIAGALDLPHLQVQWADAVGLEGTLAAALEISRTMPAPLTGPLRPAFLRILFEASRRDRRAFLTGDGADEWVAGNPHFAADLLRCGRLGAMVGLWRTLTRSYPFPVEISLRGIAWRWGARPLLHDALFLSGAPAIARRIARQAFENLRRRGTARMRPSWIANDASLHAEIDARESNAWQETHRYPKTRNYSLRFARSMLDLPQKIMFHEESFALAQRAGVRLTPPYWDSDLIDLMMTIRPQARMRDGFTKTLLRSSLMRRLPQLGFERRLKSYTGNLILSGVTEGASGARKNMGRIAALGELGVVEVDKLESFLDRALASTDHQSWMRVWEVLNLEAWARAQLARI